MRDHQDEEDYNRGEYYITGKLKTLFKLWKTVNGIIRVWKMVITTGLGKLQAFYFTSGFMLRHT